MSLNYFGNKNIVSSHKGERSDDYFTPKPLYDAIKEEFNINYDPCPYKSGERLGLFNDWGKRVFVNPPYSNIDNWINKALLELKKGNSEIVVLLLFARTGTKWFHKYFWDKNKHEFRPGVQIRFIRGRLKFGTATNSAPADSMLIILT